mgnify:CR=1 FL=1
MTQLVMTVTIGDGRVVATEFARDLERCATARDRLEAHRLEMILKARVQRFARRNKVADKEEATAR